MKTQSIPTGRGASAPPPQPTLADIAAALQAGEMNLVYQPQVDARHGALQGFEALLRWRSPRFGSVPPDRFIPLVEGSELVSPLWDFILGEVRRERAGLEAGNSAQLHVAVNCSANQLPVPGLAEDFLRWLADSRLDACQVHVEITESALVDGGEVAARNLRLLREAGVSIWLDDFGTGYSSLRYLRDLPLSGLKIDRSFVTRIVEDLADFRITSAIVAMASSLGLRVVAEGVETMEQAQVLTQLGCDTLQGYLIGRPSPMEHWSDVWARHGQDAVQ